MNGVSCVSFADLTGALIVKDFTLYSNVGCISNSDGQYWTLYSKIVPRVSLNDGISDQLREISLNEYLSYMLSCGAVAETEEYQYSCIQWHGQGHFFGMRGGKELMSHVGAQKDVF